MAFVVVRTIYNNKTAVFSPDTPDKFGLMNTASSDLKTLYDTKFIGMISSNATINTATSMVASNVFGEPGDISYTLDGSDTISVWRVEKQIDKGWVYNAEILSNTLIGKYELIQLKNDPFNSYNRGLLNTIDSLNEDNLKLREALDNSEELLDEMRLLAASRADKCRQQATEIDKLRKESDADLIKIYDLRTELKELRECTMTHTIPHRVMPDRTNSAYNTIVECIKTFDRSTLKTKKERDELLRVATAWPIIAGEKEKMEIV